MEYCLHHWLHHFDFRCSFYIYVFPDTGQYNSLLSSQYYASFNFFGAISICWLVPTNGKIVLQRQTAHADAVAGLPVPLPGLRRTAEPVWSTRLQTFLAVLNFYPLSRYNWKWQLSHQVLAYETSAFNTQNLTRWKWWVMGTYVKINAIWWNIKVNV